MKRKLLAIFLSIVSAICVTCSFSACDMLTTDSSSSEQTSANNSSSSNSSNSSSNNNTDNSSNSSNSSNSNSSNNNSSSSDDTTNTDKNVATFEAVTIVDNTDLAIKVESYTESYLLGPAFKFYLENKTSDVTLMFSITDAAVNGIMCDPFWAKELDSGLKAYSYVYFSSLEDNGINYIENVELEIRVYNSDDWLADDYYNETVTLTVQNTTSQASTFSVTSENGFTAVELVNQNGVMVKVIDFDEDYLWGPRFIVYIENTTNKTLMVTADNVGVNGYSCDPYWATEVLAGKSKYSSMYWFDSTLENNNITTIQTVTFTLRAYDSDNWLSDDIINVSITLNA